MNEHPTGLHLDSNKQFRVENMAYRPTVRESEQLRRASSVSSLRQDRVQRTQPLLRALSRQVLLPKLFSCLHAQRYLADACARQASGTVLKICVTTRNFWAEGRMMGNGRIVGGMWKRALKTDDLRVTTSQICVRTSGQRMATWWHQRIPFGPFYQNDLP